jgi:hypothetical protein
LRQAGGPGSLLILTPDGVGQGKDPVVALHQDVNKRGCPRGRPSEVLKVLQQRVSRDFRKKGALRQQGNLTAHLQKTTGICHVSGCPDSMNSMCGVKRKVARSSSTCLRTRFQKSWWNIRRIGPGAVGRSMPSEKPGWSQSNRSAGKFWEQRHQNPHTETRRVGHPPPLHTRRPGHRPEAAGAPKKKRACHPARKT